MDKTAQIKSWDDWRDEIRRIVGRELHLAQYNWIVNVVESTIQEEVDRAVRERDEYWKWWIANRLTTPFGAEKNSTP